MHWSKTVCGSSPSTQVSEDGNADDRELQGWGRGLPWRSCPLQEEIHATTTRAGPPQGLLPLEDVEEFGYHRASGFMWLVQKKKIEHTFKKIKQHVSYATEVTAFVEQRKMKKITGVKTKELLLWLSVVEVFIDDPSSGKITFKTGTGLSDSFPVLAFDRRVEEEEQL
ncbi:DUF538 domain containing protein [Musa troglodytarum]|uniref:DUF538 domain containing protein n=1 Tax=Musa troglodytarum TaxID=320322 RepID=A0A9E7K7K2_9LILI|nr:DUF538 domain containing protein [Musa troglodytarum]